MGKLNFLFAVAQEFKKKYGYDNTSAYIMALHSPLASIYVRDPILVSSTSYKEWAEYLHDWCLHEGLIENK